MKRVLKHSFSLLNIDYVNLSNKWNYNNVISPYYRIYYIDDGEGTISSLEQTLQLSAGNLYIIPSFTLCNLHCPQFLSMYFIHIFEDFHDGMSLFHNNRAVIQIPADEHDIANFKRLLHINPGRGINRSDNPKVYEKSTIYAEYEELNNMQSTANLLETQGIILQLLSKFLTSEKFKIRQSSAIPSKILDTINFINLNLNQHFTVVDLAKRVNQHKDYFSRMFTKYMGIRPVHYLQEKRIERAQHLIVTTTKSFEEVAWDTGFESIPHFFKTFKNITSLTPNQYRTKNNAID